MEIVLTNDADEHLRFWKKSGNKAIVKKIEKLLEDILKDPFSGIGKIESLKYHHQGRYSRRIDQTHRMVYEVFKEKNEIYIYSLKGHYDKKKNNYL